MGTMCGISEAESYRMGFDLRQQIVHVDDFLQALGLLLRKSNQRVVCFGNQVRRGIITNPKSLWDIRNDFLKVISETLT